MRWALYGIAATIVVVAAVAALIGGTCGALYVGGWLMFIGGISDAINLINNLIINHQAVTLSAAAIVLFKIFGAWIVGLLFFAPFVAVIALGDFLEVLHPDSN